MIISDYKWLLVLRYLLRLSWILFRYRKCCYHIENDSQISQMTRLVSFATHTPHPPRDKVGSIWRRTLWSCNRTPIEAREKMIASMALSRGREIPRVSPWWLERYFAPFCRVCINVWRSFQDLFGRWCWHFQGTVMGMIEDDLWKKQIYSERNASWTQDEAVNRN